VVGKPTVGEEGEMQTTLRYFCLDMLGEQRRALLCERSTKKSLGIGFSYEPEHLASGKYLSFQVVLKGGFPNISYLCPQKCNDCTSCCCSDSELNVWV